MDSPRVARVLRSVKENHAKIAEIMAMFTW